MPEEFKRKRVDKKRPKFKNVLENRPFNSRHSNSNYILLFSEPKLEHKECLLQIMKNQKHLQNTLQNCPF